MKKISWFLRQTFLIPVYLYKGLLSPFIGASCHYHPTCSSYMVESVMKHGIFKGSAMGFARIFRCSRFFYGGEDPVPQIWSWKAIKDGYTLFRKRRST
ncbi:MAG: membrane protein insertion efficiency factor YidD [Sphaerochaeta sp.]|jgi:putative membrane protein insertion efficiency factor|uniref:membrane protein insertion efficiency factor YidD n=1 Tax=Sphaerochaeta sp. TaxID=1972642 RepID=UPI002FC8EDFB